LADQKAVEGEVVRVRKDAQDLEDQITKAEAEKTTRDHAIRSLNDDISELDDLISKLNKEKKFFQVMILSYLDYIIFASFPFAYTNIK